jgi:hypothetical protein
MASSAGTAAFRVEPDHIDMGAAEYYRAYSAAVTLLNDSVDSMRITNIRKPCTCTVVDIKGEEIPPNSGKSITVEWRVTQRGKAATSVEIEAVMVSSPQHPMVVTLSLSAIVPGDITMEPPRLLLSEGKGKRVVYLHHHMAPTEEPLSVLNVASSVVGVAVSSSGPGTVALHDDERVLTLPFELTVDWDVVRQDGEDREGEIVFTTNNGHASTLTLPIEVVIAN